MKATAKHNLIVVQSAERLPDGDQCLTVNCEDYSALKTLPEAIEWCGQMFARTAWNSDQCVAYYKNSAWAINRLAVRR